MKADIFIIGTGLIGGSLGLALKGSPLINCIYGYDSHPESLRTAKNIGAIDEAVSLVNGASKSDIIFICSPLSHYQSIITEITPVLQEDTIITDVGSTKEEVMEIFDRLPNNIWGIGGHPMAGSEITGINGADRYLFENAVYVITPAKTPSEQVNKLIAILKNTGAKIIIQDAKTHDELVATVSHVPHLAAVALVALTQGKRDNLTLAAGGFRDTTRIASSNPKLWEDILLFNRNHILNKLDDLLLILQDIKNTILEEDNKKLLNILSAAKQIRDEIPKARKGLIPSYYDVVCIVPDEPGIIGKLGFILGEVNINIVDIEILRVREGDGGTIRLGVTDAAAARKATETLLNNNIKAWIR